MTPEEELQAFKDDYPQRLERARKIALRFGIYAIVALIALVYAFFQQTATAKHKLEYELDLRKMAEHIKVAEKKAIRFEVQAENESARARELSALCQQGKATSK